MFLQNTLFTALSRETLQHMELQSICSCCNTLRIALGFEWCEGMENLGGVTGKRKKMGVHEVVPFEAPSISTFILLESTPRKSSAGPQILFLFLLSQQRLCPTSSPIPKTLWVAVFQRGKLGTVVMLQIGAPPVSSQLARAVAITNISSSRAGSRVN